MKIFKTVNPDLRDEMCAIGFTYVIERINGEEWYSFVIPNDDANKLMGLCFQHGNFIVGETLSF